MKFGVNTFIWSAEFNESNVPLLPLIKEAGFDGVELPLLHPESFDASGIRKLLEAYALECNVCTALTKEFSFISEDADVRRKTHQQLRNVIEAAAETGAQTVAGPVYSPVGYFSGRRRTAEEWKWAVDGLLSLGDVLAANDVTLAVEPLNRFETYFLNTAADAAALAEQIDHPNIGILFDTFHANIEEKDVAKGYRIVGEHLKHVHTCENDRGTPGSGHVDWKSVFQALRDLKYDGWLTIESFGFALGDMSAAAAIWRDIEDTPDSIAFEGIKFLEKNVAEMYGTPLTR